MKKIIEFLEERIKYLEKRMNEADINNSPELKELYHAVYDEDKFILSQAKRMDSI